MESSAEGRISPGGGGLEAARDGARWSVGKGAVGVLLAVAGTAVAARLELELPATAVPLSAQTLAVLASGILLGALWGALAMVGYVIAGALGLPVFAGGVGGISRLVGPTAGYLAGFVLGAALAGRWVETGRAVRLPSAVLGMLTAHAVILCFGWARLALALGAAPAFAAGVTPFAGGALIKSVLAAGLAVTVSRVRRRRDQNELEAVNSSQWSSDS